MLAVVLGLSGNWNFSPDEPTAGANLSDEYHLRAGCAGEIKSFGQPKFLGYPVRLESCFGYRRLPSFARLGGARRPPPPRPVPPPPYSTGSSSSEMRSSRLSTT